MLGTVLRAALEGPGAGRVEGVFDGLAAGTFLYVATGHILPEEFEIPKDRWAKSGLFSLGVAIMTIVGLLV